MAAPNIVNVTTINAKTALAALATTTANVITNSSGSSTVAKVNNLTLANYTSSSVTASVFVNRSSVVYYIAGGVSIPAYSTLVLVSKDVSMYLEEGDVLQANVSANSSVSVSASYELIA
jgi:hypothetical protein